ncbi:MAG: hypothetical protein ACKV0T_16675 [Planctomycetales bacterium]
MIRSIATANSQGGRRWFGCLPLLLLLPWLGAVAADRPRPVVSATLAERISELLEEGYQSGPKHFQAAQKQLAQVHKLADQEPLLEYAWGLVLLKQSQPKPAAGQFEAALNRGGEPFWPAWRGLIWSLLSDRQYEKGLKRLDEFARMVQKSAPVEEPTASQREAASWMGQALEALDNSVSAKPLQELIDQHAVTLRQTLSDELYEAFDLGREVVQERAHQLLEQAGQEQEAAARKDQRRKAGQAGKLKNDQDDLDKIKESTSKSVEDWKRWLDDALGKADKQLSQLEKDYSFLQKRAQSLDQSITALGRDLTAMQLQMQAPDANTRMLPIQQLQNEQRMIQRQNQLLNYQIEYNATIGRMGQVAQQGTAAMRQRAAIVQKYEKATGTLVKKSADLEKWATRLADKKEKLELQTVAKAKKAKTPAERKVTLLFKNFFPFDHDESRTQLLESIGIKPSADVAVVADPTAADANAAEKGSADKAAADAPPTESGDVAKKAQGVKSKSRPGSSKTP